MDQLESTIRKSILESHLTSTTEDYPRGDSASNSGGSPLAERNLVPYTPTISSEPTIVPLPTISQGYLSQHTASLTNAELDSLRVAIIRGKLLTANLSDQAVQDILNEKLADTGTNRAYRKNQLRFLARTTQNSISNTNFSCADLINFMAEIRQTNSLQVSTLKTIRAAVAHLHDDPSAIRQSAHVL